MKKLTIISILILSYTCIFAQNVPVQEESLALSKDAKISIINENFLVHVPGILNVMDYENLNGEKIPYKQVKLNLAEIPDNKPILKSHNFWRGTTFALTGIGLAGLTTSIIYSFNDTAPYADEIYMASCHTVVWSLLLSACTTQMSLTKLLKAVDNYNSNLAKM